MKTRLQGAKSKEKVCHKQSTRRQAITQQFYTLLRETSAEALDDENITPKKVRGNTSTREVPDEWPRLMSMSQYRDRLAILYSTPFTYNIYYITEDFGNCMQRMSAVDVQTFKKGTGHFKLFSYVKVGVEGDMCDISWNFDIEKPYAIKPIV